MPLATKVAVLEFERGWGSKIDDYLICLTNEDAQEFISVFNSANTASTVPDWYMVASTTPESIELTQAQYDYIVANGNTWLRELSII